MLYTALLANNLAPNELKEAFQTATTGVNVGITIVIWIFILLICFIWSYGAAKLSWQYNMYLGNTSGSAYFNSILAFIFSNFYYPIYAYLLNPVVGKTI